MAQVFDSEKVREAARRIRRISVRVDSEVTEAVKRADGYTEDLSGATAEAMEDRLQRTRRELHRVCDGLEDISRRLRAYAAAIEAADDHVADQMRQGR